MDRPEVRVVEVQQEDHLEALLAVCLWSYLMKMLQGRYLALVGQKAVDLLVALLTSQAVLLVGRLEEDLLEERL